MLHVGSKSNPELVALHQEFAVGRLHVPCNIPGAQRIQRGPQLSSATWAVLASSWFNSSCKVHISLDFIDHFAVWLILSLYIYILIKYLT